MIPINTMTHTPSVLIISTLLYILSLAQQFPLY